jgi:hypothetical protein
MKKHLGHLAMCAPMIVIGGVLLAGGAGFGAVVPLIACVLMMTLMMGGMGHGDREGHGAGKS